MNDVSARTKENPSFKSNFQGVFMPFIQWSSVETPGGAGASIPFCQHSWDVAGLQDPFACVHLLYGPSGAVVAQAAAATTQVWQVCSLQSVLQLLGSSTKANSLVLPPQGRCCPERHRCPVELCSGWDALCAQLFLLQLLLLQYTGSESPYRPSCSWNQ